jgi:hypothetical protein
VMRAVLFAVLFAAHGCGPACLDDRCSLSAPTSQVTKVDYTNPTPSTAGSGSATAVTPTPTDPIATGSATPPATGSAMPPTGTGSGSATPPPVTPPPVTPPPTPESATWGPMNDSFKQYVTSKAALAQGTVVKLEFVKTPTKTPFVVTLETKPTTEPLGAEAVWNDCPENRIVCDATGTKSHATKRPGNVLIKAGVNWAVTNVVDDAKGTLVTWTNNLSRELLQIRLVK